MAGESCCWDQWTGDNDSLLRLNDAADCNWCWQNAIEWGQSLVCNERLADEVLVEGNGADWQWLCKCRSGKGVDLALWMSGQEASECAGSEPERDAHCGD